jgi:hypothetical protein
MQCIDLYALSREQALLVKRCHSSPVITLQSFLFFAAVLAEQGAAQQYASKR